MKTKITILFTTLMSFSFFMSAETGTVTDFDGNVYQTVKIGNQWWMAENLRTTHYYDGTAIPLSIVTKTVSADDYKDYFLYPNNDVNNVPTYGLLYSWSVTTKKSLLPDGWVLADTTAWAELAAYVGGKSIAGGKLKSTSVIWTAPNSSATDDYGFNAIPAGDCNTAGFTVFGQQARYWTSQVVDPGQAGRIYVLLSYNSAAITKGQYRNVNTLSLRFVKSTTTEINTINSNKKPLLEANSINSSLRINNIIANSQLSIYAINGTLVKSISANSDQQMEWNVSDLSKGIYILTIRNLANTTKLKFVKN